ncbi:MAG: redoxin family protein [Phycisphaerales bacterium]|nr:redoxin family protein [Phycisphaerales bacterium]
MTRVSAFFFSLAVMVAAVPASAVEIGDTAPAVTITDWVKGKPMDVLKDGLGKVVVLEFWATWCPPCIQLIPDSTEFYQKNKDKGFIFVGITDSGRGQTLEAVRDFVSRQGPKMDYPVAFDKTQRCTMTYQAYGLPHAVVIGKDGKIVWMGHPGMPEMHKIIEDLLADRYDAEAAAKRAKINAQLERMTNDFYIAMQQGQTEAALTIAGKMLDVDPGNFDAMQYCVVLFVDELKSIDRLRAWTEDFIEKNKDSAESLAKVAHLMMAIPDITLRQPDLAIKAARMAYDKGSDNREIAQAVALTYFDVGDLKTAIRYQQHAVDVAEGQAAEDAKAVLKFLNTCQSLQETAPAAHGN